MSSYLNSFLVVLATLTSLSAKEWVVSNLGDDSHAGDVGQPFATLNKAASQMKPGDICLIREGHYTKPLTIKQLHGTESLPITFKAWPGESVVIDGTQPLKAKWSLWKEGIYRAKVDQPVKQLFQNGKYLMPARWPNASIYDESVFDMHGRWRQVAAESSFGTMVDATPTKTAKNHLPWFEGSAIDRNTQTLAETGKDFTGAVAVMNIGSWLTWAQTITEHSAGSNTFSYDLDFTRSGHTMSRTVKNFPGNPKFWQRKIQQNGEGYYYIEGSLACLDAPGEWFYDAAEQWLYLIPREGKVKLRTRQSDCGLEILESSHLRFENLQMFGCYGSFTDSTSITLDGCDFLFPSSTAFGLGDLSRPEVTHFTYSKKYQKAHGSDETKNRLFNCSFKYCNGPGLSMAGVNDVVENCYFYAIDWTCLGDGGEGSLNLGDSIGMVFRRNTLDLAGNSEGIRIGRRSRVEYNHVSRTSMLQHDGSAINAGVKSIEGAVMRRNWVHDTPKAALRFDSANMGSPDVRYGYRGAMIGNVCWNTHQLKIKGEEHTVSGNTVFGSPKVDIAVLDSLLSGGINKLSVTTNNLAVTIAGSFNRSTTPIPGTHSHNWTGDVQSQLVDPDHLDFRPRKDSEIRGAGMKDGLACDIGAYQYDAANYWIPGHLSEHASMPVPQDETQGVAPAIALMWRPSLDATAYRVHWGQSQNALVESKPRTTCYFHPPSADAGTTYYWRVDTMTDDQKWITGKLWNYQIK